MIDGSADDTAAASWCHICKGHKEAGRNKDENYYHLAGQSKAQVYLGNKQAVSGCPFE
jgi:hypothetical protein